MKAKACCFNFDLKFLSSLFKALGDPSRLSIFQYMCECLRNGAKNSKVMDVAECCQVDLSVVSRHLSQLKSAGVLKSEKKGKEVFYSLNTTEIATFLRELASYLEECEGACDLTQKRSKQ